ncbi:hypothetical protein FOMG_19202 [Fusarium oxysporum f. sp. melonis 26406]|uniref:C2H2-type domain-containing protein n=1 Tax=Fusarium oxysporum f. sp. melonis 26406 TaxID=1089452 RepID=W9YY44_FUSOX|nr:hypothetical protein FOMG_19202 [Fusarium oxysporum f. sp. melonis 26406]
MTHKSNIANPLYPQQSCRRSRGPDFYYNHPEAAIICTKCGFALSPKRASEHPGKHGIARCAR